MNKVKAGVIGCGNIANYKYLPSLSEISVIDVIGFCDINVRRAQEACKKYGGVNAKVYTEYKALLNNKDIEVVYVCTPNRYHSEITVAALEAGKHVMCEKPMAINAIEAEKMMKAAKANNRILTIGYQNRFNPKYQYIKKIIAKGELGEVYFARAKAVRRRGVPTWGNFLNEREQGGGSLIDIGSHALDLVLWEMNNYKPKYAVGTLYHKLNNTLDMGNIWGDWNPDLFKVEDSAFGFLVMENGATIILESSWALNERNPQEAVFSLAGTKAGVDFENGVCINSVCNGYQSVLTVDIPFKYKLGVLEQEAFLNAILGRGEVVVTPEQAYIVTRILDGIYESAKTETPIYFK